MKPVAFAKPRRSWKRPSPLASARSARVRVAAGGNAGRIGALAGDARHQAQQHFLPLHFAVPRRGHGRIEPVEQAGGNRVRHGWPLELRLPGQVHVRGDCQDHRRIEIEHVPRAAGIADWRAVMHLAWIDRDDVAGSGLHHAAPAERLLRALPDDANAELLVPMARKDMPRGSRHRLHTGAVTAKHLEPTLHRALARSCFGQWHSCIARLSFPPTNQKGPGLPASGPLLPSDASGSISAPAAPEPPFRPPRR